MKGEGAKRYGVRVWRWREDPSRFTMMEKRLRAHSMSRLAAGDQGDQRSLMRGSDVVHCVPLLLIDTTMAVFAAYWSVIGIVF